MRSHADIIEQLEDLLEDLTTAHQREVDDELEEAKDEAIEKALKPAKGGIDALRECLELGPFRIELKYGYASAEAQAVRDVLSNHA